ncbi:MAG: hypothetical protein PF495_21190 [Spirochaetales bacterium]|jgi:hypothetical protein|nr:hypothetical protein [Spirochaetales bacterium]
MKRAFKKPKKVNKGAPSGFIISLLFHVAAFAVAGIFVVFTVMKPKPPIFEAPVVQERPKMNLKKPIVKIKRSSTPKPASRIVAKIKLAKMPEISIPDLTGSGNGLLGGLGGVGGDGLSGMGGYSAPSVLGLTMSDGRDLVGTFYDFKRNRTGRVVGWENTQGKKESWLRAGTKFMESGCNPQIFSKYYQSAKKLYTKCLVVSPTYSSIAPSAFDSDSDNVGAGFWVVHYRGKLIHKDGVTFRFVCAADYFIVILVDNEIVWAGVWNTPERISDYRQLTSYAPRYGTRQFFIGNDRAMAGEWITLEPGVARNLDIVIGDENGECGFIIAVEEQGVEYEKSAQGGPLYPIFKTDVLSHDVVDQIFKDLPEGEVSVTNGPVFSELVSRG